VLGKGGSQRVDFAAKRFVLDPRRPGGLSFRRIAADAGCQPPSLYHHFGDRDAIFAEIGLQGFRKFTAELTAPKRDDEAPEIAPRMLDRHVEFALCNKGYFRVMSGRTCAR
jgi:AcrR family transcriptional regulator